MSREQNSPLANFVREAFGASCADLLLLGLGEESNELERRFYVRDEEGEEWELVVSAAGRSFPCRSEPLVLAALLKMLVGRDGVPSPLEFPAGEVVDEMLLAGVSLKEREADRIISKYVSLSYDKRLIGGDGSEGRGGGLYQLMTGYFRRREKEDGVAGAAPISGSVYFDRSFIAGLRRGEVVVAGVRFGRLRSPPRG